MRFRLFGVLAVLLLVGSNDARPPNVASPEVAEEETRVSSGNKDNTPWRPIEPRSSSAARNDSRYRGRMQNGRKFNDNRYRNRFTTGILNSLKANEDFGLSNDWLLLGATGTVVNCSNNGAVGFSGVEPKVLDGSGGRTNLRKNRNDKFLRIFSAPFEGLALDNRGIRPDDHELVKATKRTQDGTFRLGASLPVLVRAKNRVVIRPSSDGSPLSHATKPQPASLVGENDQRNVTKEETKTRPSETSQDLRDLFNYEKYTSNFESLAEHSPALNYGDAPIYVEKKKKKPASQSFGPVANYHSPSASSYHDEVVLTHHKDSETPAPVSSNATHNRDPYVQEIVQWLRIPPFTASPNQSHPTQQIPSGESVANSFNQNYHSPRPIKPLRPLATYYEPPNGYPDSPDTTQGLVGARPIGNNHHHQLQNVMPDNLLDNRFPLGDDSYEQSDNHNNHHSTQIVSKPSTTLASHFQPSTTYSEALATAQSYVKDSPVGNNYYEQLPSKKPTRPSDNHYLPPGISSEQPHDLYLPPKKPVQPGNHYLPVGKPSQHVDNDHHRPDNNFQSNHNFQPPRKPSYPVTEAARPSDTVNLPNSVVNLLTELATKKPSIYRRPIFRPSSEVSQNTVVHILNPGSKKPNVTVSEMEVPQVEKPSGSLETNSSVGTPPNVHIMFMNEDMPNSEKPTEDKVPESAFQATNCPTIMINSITRVNNTVESKEGCTDLNIVINSQVLSTNVFKPGSLSEADDKYVGDVSSESSQEYPNDNSVNSQDPNASGMHGSDNDFGAGEVEDDADRNELNETVMDEEEAVNTFTATSEVVSESQVIINTGNSQEAAFDTLGGGSVEEAAAAAPASVPATDSVAASAPVAAAPAAVADPGTAVGQALGAPATAGIQLPGIPGILGAAPLSGLAGSAGGASGGSGGIGSPGSTALATLDDDDDDDDDDDFDLTPSGLMESVGSVFTYFTFLNPLNYSLFSLAAAPFAAMAAGVIGIAAVFFPWTLPGVLDLGRAADRGIIGPSLNEVVKQSMYKYRNWHEWKSKRRKRKR